MFASSRDLLTAVLEERTPSLEELRAFIEEHPFEDSYIDFKSGLLIGEESAQKKVRREIRQYISAFANSDGGVLVLGVSDPVRDEAGKLVKRPELAPAKLTVGKNELRFWIRDLVKDMVSYFGQVPSLPPPLVVDQNLGVQLVGVARAPSYVPCIDEGQLTYWFRFGDATIRAEPWLMTDLQLGRRRHSTFSVHVVEEALGAARLRSPKAPGDPESLAIQFKFRIVNDSLVHARDVRVALLGIGVAPDGDVVGSLRQQVHLDGEMPHHCGLVSRALAFPSATPTVHGASETQRIRPFEVKEVLLQSSIAIPILNAHPDRFQRWEGALLVLPEDMEPRWFQLVLEHRVHPRADGWGFRLDVEPVWGRRPIVRLDVIDLL